MKNVSIPRLILILLALGAIASCSKNDEWVNEAPVSETHNELRSLKTTNTAYIPGTDITVQLRNDLSSGLDIKLPPGQFFVSESIIIFGYSGTVKGAGKDETIIEVAQGFKATEDPSFPPFFKLTEVFAVYASIGDVTFKDMTILVTGDAPAEVHFNPFHEESTAIDNVIVVAGAHDDIVGGITVTFSNLKILGQPSNDPLSCYGKNLAYPLIATGFTGSNTVNAVIKHCEIEHCGTDAIEYWDVFGGTGEIKENVIANSHGGIWTGAWTDPLTVLGELMVKNNTFKTITWGAIFNNNSWSGYCLKDNTLDGVLIADDCHE